MSLKIFRVFGVLLLIYQFKYVESWEKKQVPCVINTWPFVEATREAWNWIKTGYSAVDAVVAGCSTCEKLQCDGTVGYGGSPDENGETTLDAMVFDGATMDMGAVGAIRNIKNAIEVARDVLKYTKHSLLVGNQATLFAQQMGFKKESLSTNASDELYNNWKSHNCQPNNWRNVYPDSNANCGPYSPIDNNYDTLHYRSKRSVFGEHNHDTIGMIAIDSVGNIAAGTSTNGKAYKIPGRVGDSPIPGAGAYADNNYGAAVATGDGDIMMRFLPSFLAVEELRHGSSPTLAAKNAINRILKYYPDFFGAVVVTNNKGRHAAACNGMPSFHYSVANPLYLDVEVLEIKCRK